MFLEVVSIKMKLPRSAWIQLRSSKIQVNNNYSDGVIVMPFNKFPLNPNGSLSVRCLRLALACTFAVSLGLIACSTGFAQATDIHSTDAPAKVDAKTKALHDKLAKYLSGTKWTGEFTMTGKKETRTEHYEILSAEKGETGDYWNLVARIKYGGNDATLPLPPIEIKFAGSTPVITVDKAFFPGFGTFDARVLIRKGQYAGTWAHIGEGGGVGGHMFGTIEKMDADEVKKKANAVKPETKNDSKK